MPQATVQANNANETQQDQQGNQRQGEVQGDRDQARDQLQQGIQTGEEAISQLVHAYAEAFRSFVPNAFFRPSEAIDFVYDLTSQVLGLQRRFVQELFGAVQSNLQAVQNAADSNGENRNGNGRQASLQVRS